MTHLGIFKEMQRLRDRVEELELMLDIREAVPPQFGLTPREAELVSLLHGRGSFRRKQAFVLLYGMRNFDEQPDDKILNVHMHRVRRKLRAHGIEVSTNWGVGYYLTVENRARLKALIEGVNG